MYNKIGENNAVQLQITQTSYPLDISDRKSEFSGSLTCTGCCLSREKLTSVLKMITKAVFTYWHIQS
jgi:hypothetical protein